MLLFKKVSEDPTWEEWFLKVIWEPEKDEELFRKVGYIQLLHDSKFHTDIYNLPIKDKLVHYTLHLTKYSVGLTSKDRAKLYGTLLDTFIICVAMCNAMKYRVYEIVRFAIENQALSSRSNNKDFDLNNYMVQVASLAKACESLDHIEDCNIHSYVRNALVELMGIIFKTFAINTVDYEEIFSVDSLLYLTTYRLLMGERKHIFYKQLKNEQRILNTSLAFVLSDVDNKDKIAIDYLNPDIGNGVNSLLDHIQNSYLKYIMKT